MKKMNRFRPPTAIEVTEYARSIDFELDGEAFVDYYQQRGWRPNKCTIQMKSWKAAVRTWKRYDKKQTTKKTKLFPIPGRHCSKRSCYMPAVYKDSKGDYDYFTCAEHMPIMVKERYE